MVCSICGNENTHESWCTTREVKPHTVISPVCQVEDKPTAPIVKEKEKVSWLCRIGWHDWQSGWMGWGAGHPVYCTRCGKGGTDSDFGVY